jgi:hypothetical protein
VDKTNYQLIQQMDESSIRDLETNIQRGFPNTTKRQHATGTVQIPIVKLTPYVPSSALFAEGQANNMGKRYNPEVFFKGIKFEPEETQTNVTFTGSDNNEYNIAQAVPLNTQNVQVRCNCLDFHYRFAMQNARDGSLYGKPPPSYQRKTETRPPANPAQVPGMCKHLLKTVDELQKMGIVAKG